MPTAASHVWKPSRARTVMLDGFVPVPRGSTSLTPIPLSWPAKDPSDILDYTLDITPAVAGNEGDGVASIDVGIVPDQPGDLSAISVAADGPAAVLWLSGGQSGTVYTVTISIVTTSGRALSRSVFLPVQRLANPLASAIALETESGTVLTDQNGNPVLAP